MANDPPAPHPQAPAAGVRSGRQSVPGALGISQNRAGMVADSPLPTSTQPKQVVLGVPAAEVAVGECLVVRIGSIYKLEGFLNGKPVTYVGKANEIKVRIGRDAERHNWGDLVKDAKTKVSIRKVYANPDANASGRGTARSARNEALLSQEEKALRQTEQEVEQYNKALRPGESPVTVLNDKRPAAGENMRIWQERHSATSDEKWDVIKSPGSSTIVFRAFIGLQVLQVILDAILQERNRKMALYRWALYVFLEQDDQSSFTLSSEESWWGFVTHYRKTYITGPRKGTTVEISKDEYNSLADEGHALYGDVDFWGDFIPGMLLPKLPIVPAYDPNMA